MENAAATVNGFHSGDKVAVEDEIVELRVEESADAGLDESKVSEGEDDVFEEAVTTPIVGSQDAGVNESGNFSKDGELNGSLEVGENSNEPNKSETFEEASEVPLEDVNHGEPIVIEDKVEDLVDGEPIGKSGPSESIDHPPEELVNDKVVKHEVNDHGDNASVVDDKDEARELSDITAVEDVNILKDEGEGDGDSDVVLEKSERGISSDSIAVKDLEISEDVDETDKSVKTIPENVNMDVPLVHCQSENEDAKNESTQVWEDPEKGDVTKVVLGDTSSHQEVESNGDMHQAESSEEVREILSDPDSKKEDDMSKELESDLPDDKVEVLKDLAVELNGDVKDDNGVKLKEIIQAPRQLDVMDQEKDKLSDFDIKKQDEIERVLEDTSVTVVAEHNGESRKLEDDVYAPEIKNSGTLEAQSSPSSVESAAESGDKIQPGASHVKAEKSKVYQPQNPDDENFKVLNGDTVEPEMKEAKREVNGSTQGNKDHQTKTTESVQSLSAEATNSAPTPARPAGLGRAAPLLEPASRAVQQPRVNGTVSQMQNQLIEDPTNGEAEENDETREKLQMIRVKFLRLAHRLGQTPHNVVVAQVLYRLGLAEQLRGRNGGRVAAFSFDRASAMAEQLEAAGQEPLDFSCTIMVLGKTGVGKSATINSIFDEVKFSTDAFKLGTKKVQDVVGTVQGIKVRVIDTPGLLPSWSDQRHNEKILHSIKRFISKTPPDIVLYLDRLDMQSSDFGDLPLLRTITEIFGPAIWFNAIVVLTHAASAPPEGPNGTATSYDMFVSRRSQVVQQAIRQAAGDMRLLNPVSLVENHLACRTNRAGQRVLPNGQIWKPHLLLLSFASKILAEANALLKLQDSPPGKPFPTRLRAPPLPYLLLSLLQSRPQLKLPEEQFGDDDDNLDDDLDVSSDSDEESEYDELPPFKRLTKAQLAKLTKAQKKAYNDELEYREKLFMKKQLKEERRRRKLMKKMAAAAKDLPDDYTENGDEESGAAGSVPVPMPDLSLPASFDSDNPTHRYRYLDSNNQWLVRPVLDSHGWDHDVGYEGINVERLFVVKEKVPVSFSGQVTKDKKDATLQLEVASSLKHGEGKATSVGFDMQNIGKDIAYTLRSETRFSNYRRNKATAGLSVTVLGDAVTAGVKVEDKLIVNKQFKLVVSGGALTGRGDVAYGGSLEATLRDKDYPLGRFLSTLGLSVMDWHGDLALGWNFQAHLPVGRSTNLIGRFNLNNKGSGQVSLRLNSSEQIQLALVGILPLLRKLLVYPQELQFGYH